MCEETANTTRQTKTRAVHNGQRKLNAEPDEMPNQDKDTALQTLRCTAVLMEQSINIWGAWLRTKENIVLA